MTTEVEHNVTYEGVEFLVKGEYDTPDETTGYKGGFSWNTIEINDSDVSWMLKEEIIDKITDLVVELNY